MSKPNPTAPLDPLVRSLVEMWTAYVEKASSQLSGPPAGGAGPACRDAQRRWVAAGNQAMDAYLRSPLFLQMMKTHIETLIRQQKSLRDWAASQAASPGGGQAEIVSRMQRIERRLEQLERKLNEQRACWGPPAGPPSAAANPQRSGPHETR